MLHCHLGHLTKIIRWLIVIHKAQVHQALLQLFYDLMTHTDPQVLRSRLRIRQVNVVKSGQDLSLKPQLCNSLRHSLDLSGLRRRGIALRGT